MPETLEDVKHWLEVGIKALFPFDAETIAVMRECTVDAHPSHDEKLTAQANRLQHRLDTFKIKIEEEYLIIGAFSISSTEYAGDNSVHTPDGSLDNEKVNGFVLEVTVPIRGTRDTPPDQDIAEVGKFPTAAAVAQKVFSLIVDDWLSNAFTAEAEARDWEDTKQKAEQFFEGSLNSR